MLNSTILDVAIGLVFCFASVALFVSAVHEGIASLLKLRHETLRTGIKQLLNDPNGTGLALKLYNHALVNPLTTPANAADPNAKLTMPAHGDLPAYIPSTDFAAALLDVLPNAPKDFAAVQASVGTITDPQLKQLLQGMLARSDNDLNTLRKHIAAWFDNAMDRLSGGYKRQTQLVTFLLGLFAAGLLNINAIFVLEKLWERPSLAAALSSPDSVNMIAAVAKSPLVAAFASSSGASALASAASAADHAASAADSGKSLND